MGEVYSRAQVVYVWLGAGNAKTLRAMTALANPPFLDYFVTKSDLEDGLCHMCPFAALCSYYLALSGPIGPVPNFGDHSGTFPYGTVRFCASGANTISSFSAMGQPKNSESASRAFDDLNELLGCEWPNRIWTYSSMRRQPPSLEAIRDEHYTATVLHLRYRRADD